MIADALKKALLQAAIQGKLTDQLPEDGDARDLLKEIQKEKARLVKEGKIKKERPLPEITEDEIPFDIPENWVWVRLGDYIDFKLGKTPSRGESSYWGKDIPWVSISDMNDQPVIMNTKEKISNKAFIKVFNGKIVPKGTLLMSFKLTIGRMSFLGVDALHNEAIISINPIIKNLISDNYLFKVLPFFARTGQTKGAIKGETLNSTSIRGLLFPLAPLAEQERIIQKLDQLLPDIDALQVEENKLNNLEKAFPSKIRASILQAAIQGKLTDQLPEDGDARDLLKEIEKEKARLIKEGKLKKEKPLPEITEDEIPFDIPENWAWARLGDCNEMMTGNSIPKEVKAKKYSTNGDGLPYVATKDVSANYEIDYENGVYIPLQEPSFKIANKNSTLLCVEGGSAGRKIAMTDREVCFGNKLCKFEAWTINPKYVFYYLQTNEFGKLFKGEMTGIIGGVGIDRLKNIPICLPPLAEQERIVQELDDLLPLCAELR